MKTELDPLFEQKDNRDFGRRLRFELAVILITSFVIALLLVILYFGEAIDRVPPLYQVVFLVACALLFALSRFIKWIGGFKHNDQR